jgi:hypothetical protein
MPPPPNGATALNGPQPPYYRGCTTTLRHTTLTGIALDEWSAWRRASTWQETTLSRDTHPWTRWDSNPQSEQASGRKPMPCTARPLESPTQCIYFLYISCYPKNKQRLFPIQNYPLDLYNWECICCVVRTDFFLQECQLDEGQSSCN